MAVVQDTEKQGQLEPGDTAYKFTDMVDFKIAYPKDYKKADGKAMPKYYKDGDIVRIHAVQAKDWAERGIGSIVKSGK